MSKRLKKGYYVKGIFVAEGSERDLELKRELKAQSQIDPDKPTRTEMKAISDALQVLGLELTQLRDDLLSSLDLPLALNDAIEEHKRTNNREAKRRLSQYIGKLMRKLSSDQLDAIQIALKAQARGAPRLIQGRGDTHTTPINTAQGGTSKSRKTSTEGFGVINDADA